MNELWLIDANPFIRYLLNDIPEMADETEQRIKEGAWTTIEVLAEVSYVLTKVYGMLREPVYECLLHIANSVHFEDKKLIIYALDLYHNYSMDFVDCVLIARNHLYKTKIFSFDKKIINKLIPSNM